MKLISISNAICYTMFLLCAKSSSQSVADIFQWRRTAPTSSNFKVYKDPVVHGSTNENVKGHKAQFEAVQQPMTVTYYTAAVKDEYKAPKKESLYKPEASYNAPKKATSYKAPTSYSAPKKPIRYKAPSTYSAPKKPTSYKGPTSYRAPQKPTNYKAPSSYSAPKKPTNYKAPSTYSAPKKPTNYKAPSSYGAPKKPTSYRVPPSYRVPKYPLKFKVPIKFKKFKKPVGYRAPNRPVHHKPVKRPMGVGYGKLKYDPYAYMPSVDQMMVSYYTFKNKMHREAKKLRLKAAVFGRKFFSLMSPFHHHNYKGYGEHSYY